MSFRDVIEQILSFQKLSLNRELYDFGKTKNIEITSSGFIQQRAKIKPKLFEDLFHEFNKSSKDLKTIYGYRIFAVDGSDINIARDKDAPTFIASEDHPKGGYNQYHLNVLFDPVNKVFIECILQPRPQIGEREALIEMLKRTTFQEKSLIIGDRGYESYHVLKHLLDKPNVEFIIRLKQGYSAMKPIRSLPMEEWDKDIEFTVTTTQTLTDKQNGHILNPRGSNWDFESPCKMKIRFVRILLDTGEYETVATSLDRAAFPASRIKELYYMRWGIETAFRDLKYTSGIVHLLSRKDESIRQEIYASLIMFNFCARIAVNITIHKERRKYGYKVNFKMAFSVCRRFFLGIRNGPELIMDICKYLTPIRPGRRDTRNVRRQSFVSFNYRIAA